MRRSQYDQSAGIESFIEAGQEHPGSLMKINVLKRAKEVLETEACAVLELKPRINARFKAALELILKARGRVVVSGMGKTGIIAQKFSATLASTGTPSLYLHLAEAIHGDLGRVTREDVVIVLSNSGAGD